MPHGKQNHSKKKKKIQRIAHLSGSFGAYRVQVLKVIKFHLTQRFQNLSSRYQAKSSHSQNAAVIKILKGTRLLLNPLC